jgi:hypothetical protein
MINMINRVSAVVLEFELDLRLKKSEVMLSDQKF